MLKRIEACEEIVTVYIYSYILKAIQLFKKIFLIFKSKV